ncbi:c-type cytochrome [Myxococcus sp. CA033]|uniref:c-type cytochrome n=1 Tax=Myxococcus sp. CA033 TaxID=2741516 RepID=UPI00157BB2C9|nr:c-type cytochrome [Myxococcus sp. CA033]NTX36119.1 c-type cytochrome [Myxococcus sp. CA033]
MRREVRGSVRSTLLLGLLLAGCAGTVKAPYPPIRADTSPAALARGAVIFHASCEACHRSGDAETASGAPLHELPSYMGDFHSSNLTSHPTAGIGAATDEELARVIRYAVSRDGRLMVMPSYGMGDKDLAAVLGFMRSGHPLFTPDATPAPRSDFSFIGGLGFRVITGNEPVQRPVVGIPVPPKGPTLEYGRYMAQDVYDCASCHTPGFSPDKTQGDDVFSGGMSFKDPEGQEVHSSNITFHETGLAHWTRADFMRAVRDGIAPDGSALRSPMPRFRGMDEEEAQALYDYLRSMPPRKNAVDGARPRLTATTPRPEWVTPVSLTEDVREVEAPAEAAPTGEVAHAPAPTSGQSVATPAEATSAPASVATTGATAAPSSSASASAPPKVAPPAPRKPRVVPARVDAPKLFTQLGCAGCHAPGARYHDRLARASRRGDAELVRWVRNPEQFQPGTTMPTYAELLDVPTALALVRWVKSGGPATLPPVSH